VGPHPTVAAVRLAVRRGLADLAPGALVLVACSGGADSLALAAAAAHEAPGGGLRAGGVTVDHGLQAGSAGRAREVAALLARLGLDPVEVVRVGVGAAGGPEAAARAARRGALAAAAARLGASAVLLGHTRDDQAETVLLGLARGSGARSLAGMAPVSGLLRRPLLETGRATTRAACAAQGLPVWDDPHNEDPAFTRARVRHQALPALTAALGPGVPEALARSARLLRDDADALDAWAQRAAAEVTGPDGSLAATDLAAQPAAVRRRVLRAAALRAGCPATDLTAGHVAELDRLVVGWHGQGPLHLPGDVAARRRCGRLALAPRAPGRAPGPDPSGPRAAADPAEGTAWT
jgi:tRNA(Ile)-lysidine synthase